MRDELNFYTLVIDTGAKDVSHAIRDSRAILKLLKEYDLEPEEENGDGTTAVMIFLLTEKDFDRLQQIFSRDESVRDLYSFYEYEQGIPDWAAQCVKTEDD